MSNQLRSLYQQIKDNKITHNEALQQIAAFNKREEGAVQEEYLSTLNRDESRLSGTDLAVLVRQYLNVKLTNATHGLKDVDPKMNLMDLGLESSQMMDLTRKIGSETGIELLPTLFFEYPSINELVVYFSQAHAGAFGFLSSAKPTISTEHAEGNLLDSQDSIPVEQQAVKEAVGIKDTNISAQLDDIAVIGMHGRFAGSADLEEFWSHLENGQDLVTVVPQSRWDMSLCFDSLPGAADKTYCKWGSYIDGVDQFDAEFFNISPREADWMDPQLRLLLQSTYACAEDAGYAGRMRSSDTGVFIGACGHDYARLIDESAQPVDPYEGTGNSQTVLANRISFNFDFSGPSVAVDTACSSSLFALHQACQALRKNECEMAFVGGVNLILSSWRYRYFSSIGALSHKGRCHSFDEQADGYVPAECVGSILLKPLKKALQDGDRIHAVIKGSAALHGGYTPSLTAPSVDGEANVIVKAWEEASIPPETISYIEAHGTGTKLGDPIEVQALNKAFGRYTEKTGFCTIGTVKSNIGHAEGAAGIAGLLKVILQLKHKKIPKIAGFNTLNPYIKLEGSPLKINPTLQEWTVADDVPRRAGISSFGFSGAYAHTVLEEYEAEASTTPFESVRGATPVIIVLSAHSDEQLRSQAKKLLEALEGGSYNESDLPRIAFTLQVGRQGMGERLALIGNSLADVTSQLSNYLQHGGEQVFKGSCDLSDAGNVNSKTTIEKLIAQSSYDELAQFWVDGGALDWLLLYPEQTPTPISLPSYVFAKARFWIPDAVASVQTHSLGAESTLHPLLQRNTSNFQEQRFTTTFSGQEFFLKDHIVKGEKVLPGVNYLEMARAAVELSYDLSGQEGKAINLKNVVWLRPVVVGSKPVTVHIRVFFTDSDEVSFHIVSDGDADVGNEVIHCQGRALVSDKAEVPVFDIAALKEETREHEFSAERCYEILTEKDFIHGPSLRGLTVLYEESNQVIGKITLPNEIADSVEHYVLNPCMMDSGIQSTLALLVKDEDQQVLPFAVDNVEVYQPCCANMWSIVRYSDSQEKGVDVQKYDIYLCDETGTLCVAMKGYSTRALQGRVGGTSLNLGVELPSSGEALETESDNTAEDVDQLTSKVYHLLVKTAADTLRTQSEALNGKSELSNFGFDSITLTAFANKLNEMFALNLTPTLFFEHKNLNSLTQYFATEHKTLVATKLGAPAQHRAEQKSELLSDLNTEPAFVHTKGKRFSTQAPKGTSPAFSGNREDIAIVGISGKFPQAENIDEFWTNLQEEHDSIEEIPKDRWDWEAIYGDPLTEVNKCNIKWGGFIEGIRNFDPAFFGISPREAELMDPQQRLMMTYVWKAMEDAGYSSESLSGSNTGVFVGTVAGSYGDLLLRSNIDIQGYTSTGKTPSIGPNRLSYLLNIHGPSEPVETACSSSLIAIHRAVRSINEGECDMAFVGGVNTIITPDFHISFNKNGMLSKGGRCKTFSKDADGYVRGEGVGMLMIKRLSQAKLDGDNIYAVIRGTAENHGGRSNSLTAPNPSAQAALIHSAYTESGIDPRTIGYIEAHGTGTSLGDPIEINGLKSAFKKLYSDVGESTASSAHCGLGSVKSNIGHLELASGVAGVIKVIMQLKHKKLVKTLHCDEVNPYIDLAESPFYLVQETKKWEKIADDIPRRAGVSSFGFGGANCHVIIEEYNAPLTEKTQQEGSQLQTIILSAKNEARLRHKVQDLLGFLNDGDYSDDDLEDIAYTLQVGRDSMEARLGMQAESLQELKSKLQSYLSESEPQSELYQGVVKANSDIFPEYGDDSNFSKKLDVLFAYNDTLEILKFWVKGLEVDWRRLYSKGKPSRLSLPSYPFKDEVHWIPESDIVSIVGQKSGASQGQIHPLLHQNQSDFSQQRYTSVFSGQEFFLDKHRVKGVKILPGVAYLEMVRAAISDAVDTADYHIQLNNVVWLRPLIVKGEPVEVNVSLALEDDDSMSFEVYSQVDDLPAMMYCQGTSQLLAKAEVPTVNLENLRSSCTESYIAATACYQQFRGFGFEHGDAFQGLVDVQSSSERALGRLRLPTVVAHTAENFVLHPSLLDSGLHATVSLVTEQANRSGQPFKLALPFELTQVTVYGQCESDMWAVVSYSDDNLQMSQVQKYDISLCDNSGVVCVQMEGYSTRSIVDDKQEEVVKPGKLHLMPTWRSQRVDGKISTPAFAKHLVVACDFEGISGADIDAAMGDDITCICIPAESSEGVDNRFQLYTERLLAVYQELIKSRPQSASLIQVIYPEQGNNLLQGLSGLMKSVQMENGHLLGQLIQTDESSLGGVVAHLSECAKTPETQLIRYSDGNRHVGGVAEIAASDSSATLPWKESGTYLITGGTGGLGLLFAHEIAEKVKAPTLILTGRSIVDQKTELALQALTEKGVKAHYRQMDVVDIEAVELVVTEAMVEFGGLDGVIHAAGIVRDGFVENKSVESLRQVMAPKVRGTTILDRVCADIELDLFVLFSSLAGSFGNTGQSDYAAANGYMDAFSVNRNKLVETGHRHGRTVSIAWPLWRDGGMQVDPSIEKIMAQRTGLQPLGRESGIQSFYSAVASDSSQVMVLEGQTDVMRRTILPPTPVDEVVTAEEAVTDNTSRQEVVMTVRNEVVQLAAEILSMDVSEIQTDLALSDSGFEPSSLSMLVAGLGEHYQLELSMVELSSSGSLDELIQSLVTDHGSVINQQVVSEVAPIEEATPVTTKNTSVNMQMLEEKILNLLTQMICKTLKIRPENIEDNAEFSTYGFDSIMLMEFANSLNNEFGLTLTPTIFFENSTRESLAAYMKDDHTETFTKLFNMQGKPGLVSPTIAATPESASNGNKLNRKRRPVTSAPVMVAANRPKEADGVAVVGMSGKLPMAENLDEFWANIAEGRDCIQEIPLDRWDWRAVYGDPKTTVNKTNIKWGGFIDGVDEFDPLFFGISRKEAELMDPQQRMIMAYSWKSIEDAGYASSDLAGTNTALFVGTAGGGYSDLLERAGVPIEGYSSTGKTSSLGPNRTSYYFDFHGPSEPVETACSSSLVAIHRAVDAITSGVCDLALAGGINIIVTPDLHTSFSKNGMLSVDGRCKTFSKNANGYVRGEGVGMLFLKRLSDAERDGDHIYGVIRGSSENHGGRSNSLTAPNPKSQADLLVDAYQKAGVDPRTVTFIEAHGTGTSLGDPVEVDGLKRAFKTLYQETGDTTVHDRHCGLGSAKTNIGHLEFAAGVTGVIKVLLQMKHKTLVESLHSEEINPFIQLEESPFYVVRESQQWKRLKDKQDREIPRRAGVSSFGFGGVNAHVVIEEYVTDDVAENRETQLTAPVIVVLSARNEARLKEQATQLLSTVKTQDFEASDLLDIAYTLQVGREPMVERLAIVVRSLEDLVSKLNAYLEEICDVENIFFGNIKANKGVYSLFNSKSDLLPMQQMWVDQGNLSKLADAWSKGIATNWELLHTDHSPRRISLPTYPFARERYWVPEIKEGTRISGQAGSVSKLHPLLHRNTSDFEVQRFSSTFSGNEPFLADHIVKGRKILPGVAYLELARAAVVHSSGLVGERVEVDLLNVVWPQPFVVDDQPRTLNVKLVPKEGGDIGFEIYSESAAPSSGVAIHCRGRAQIGELNGEPTVAIDTLQKQCDQRYLSSADCYLSMRQMGFEHGPFFQGLSSINTGENQLIGKLELANTINGQYFIHPGILDSALQAGGMLDPELQKAISMISNQQDTKHGSRKIYLPFAIEKVIFIAQSMDEMWVHARYAEGHSSLTPIKKIDIDLCDKAGKVCVQLIGYSYREMVGEVTEPQEVSQLLLRPEWKESVLKDDASYSYSDHLVVVCEHNDSKFATMAQALEGARCMALPAVHSDSAFSTTADRFQQCVELVVQEIQGMLARSQSGNLLLQVISCNPEDSHIYAGITGLLKTAQLENSRFLGQFIEVEDAMLPEIIERVRQSARRPYESCIRYQGGRRLISEMVETGEVYVASSAPTLPWVDSGSYLITGGVGGIGLIVAKDIAQQVETPTLILTGRSELSDEQKVRLNSIIELGATVEYRQVDVSDRAAVNMLIQSIVFDGISLNGILHAAGVVKDNYIPKKTATEIRSVMSAKVDGTINLDEATQDIPLDFFLMFSSLAGCFGNPGQSDYAAANGFMDAHANYRNKMVAHGIGHGKSISINWPLWKEGGMQLSEQAQTLMLKSTGMVPLSTQSGIAAIYGVIGSDEKHVAVFEGDEGRIKQRLRGQNQAAKARTETSQISRSKAQNKSETNSDEGAIEQSLKQYISAILKIEPQMIEGDEEFNAYGFDSISLMEFANRLNQKHDLELMPTLFFEYQNLNSLVGYFAEEHSGVFAPQLDTMESVATVSTKPNGLKNKANVVGKLGESRFARSMVRHQAPPTPKAEDGGVAIIGMSGKFPMAESVHELWDNIVQGKDCIEEIPKERWDWEALYGNPHKETNKTNIKWGGFIKGIGEFDPLFFGISPREAEHMDPQQRLLMMHAWNAIEDAGYSAKSLSGSNTGMIVGTCGGGYSDLLARAGGRIEGFTSTGMIPSSGPNRMSYFMNFHGPSEPIETACSSSLVAIHRAVMNINSGACETSIVGGVNTLVSPDFFISFNQNDMLSEDGRCKTFSKDANGYVRGEGVGMLLLKQLDAAERDDDHIYGVIRATAENHGGRANSWTAPNPKAQAELIRGAYAKAGVDPSTVSYIEAHGTGTPLGDPIEINGLKRAFKDLSKGDETSDSATPHCGLGSVKSNIGHLELAAGIAGVMKVLMQLKHKTLVKTLHCEETNPYIDLKQSPFYIVKENMEWKASFDENGVALPRRAGVSSFGFGGANAHVLIEEYLQRQQTHSFSPNDERSIVILLSAKNNDRLKARAQALVQALDGQDFTDRDLANIAYTLQVGREEMEDRLAMTVYSLDDLKSKLKAYLRGELGDENIYHGNTLRDKKVLAVYSAKLELSSFSESLVVEKNWEKLASLWCKGLVVDWSLLYKTLQNGSRPCRISLPTYPFSKQRYWLPQATVESFTKSEAKKTVNETAATNETVVIAPAEAKIKPQLVVETPAIGVGQDLKAAEKEVLCALTEELKVPENEIELNRDLQDYGVDSIVSLKLIRKLEELHDVKISGRQMLDLRTVEDLSRFLVEAKSNKEGGQSQSNQVPLKDRDVYVTVQSDTVKIPTVKHVSAHPIAPAANAPGLTENEGIFTDMNTLNEAEMSIEDLGELIDLEVPEQSNDNNAAYRKIPTLAMKKPVEQQTAARVDGKLIDLLEGLSSGSTSFEQLESRISVIEDK